MSKNKILNQIAQLARLNGTTGMLHEVSSFVEQNFVRFEEDYHNTSQRDRFSTGKLEKKLFMYLADLCNWNNGNENAQVASNILNDLGYHSYKMKEKRFRQKVENEKKKKRKGPKGRSTRSLNKKYIAPKRKEMEDSYTESDGEARDIYFPKNKSKSAMKGQIQESDVSNPLHINEDGFNTRQKNGKVNDDTHSYGPVLIDPLNNDEENKSTQNEVNTVEDSTMGKLESVDCFPACGTTHCSKRASRPSYKPHLVELAKDENHKTLAEIVCMDVNNINNLNELSDKTWNNTLLCPDITIIGPDVSLYNVHWNSALDHFVDDSYQVELEDRFNSLNPSFNFTADQFKHM